MSEQIFTKPITIETVEKNSRFIGFGSPCANQDEFNQFLQDLKSEYRDASHHTFAYHIRDHGTAQIRASDDGEPSGTAGKPILNHLQGNRLINTAIVVVRYFGGIKLGAGGLVRAYGNCAREVIQAAQIEPYIEQVPIAFSLAYDQQRHLEYCLERAGGSVISTEYTQHMKCWVQIPKDHVEDFLGLLGLDRDEVSF
ncbi:IMPACT family protein [Pseudobacteriovorax antillogorgiicola]|uniref:Uncharacterized protein, YigZ family n=1 Tax=Pseudobacteriovorax antillogorgiicola TaxID=1513793 RepID=A0A1Y6BD43_9BACT|nr:YigZ family protein [Pseudobacteriovorax antillogorgiicola]TCS58541.1 putative YigZ family protein [Pseudobacteriovorax antillogorgiicola]SME97806.1 uncharacterized protein, YigZ family [Pseudobacteriovorax antillogorgiicola]